MAFPPLGYLAIRHTRWYRLFKHATCLLVKYKRAVGTQQVGRYWWFTCVTLTESRWEMHKSPMSKHYAVLTTWRVSSNDEGLSSMPVVGTPRTDDWRWASAGRPHLTVLYVSVNAQEAQIIRSASYPKTTLLTDQRRRMGVWRVSSRPSAVELWDFWGQNLTKFGRQITIDLPNCNDS